MTWEGLFVILALQFRSILKILDLLREKWIDALYTLESPKKSLVN